MHRILLLATLTLALAQPAFANAKTEPDAAKEEPKLTPEQEAIHTELRAMREALLKAVEANDVEGQLALAHPEIVVIWQNGDVTRGHEGLKALLEKMKSEQGKIFLRYKEKPTIDARSVLHAGGNTAVAQGHSVGVYKLLGKEVELTNKFSATVTKTDGKWLLAGYHVSNNVLDNPLLNTAKSALMIVGSIAGVVGILLGFVIAKLMTKKA